MEINKILQGDSLQVLKTLPDESIDCCITSPPYWGLRDYGSEGQMGLEKTPMEFVKNIVILFREVRRALKDEGTLWLNLGDSYASTKEGNTNGTAGKVKQKAGVNNNTIKRTIPLGLKPKDLCGIPWRVAFALQADGWYLRQDIIWAKPNPMPESVTDRCTKSHEYVFLLSKNQRYYFNNEAIKEKAVTVQPLSHPAGWDSGKDHTAIGWNTEKNRFRTGVAYLNQKKGVSNHKKNFDSSQAGGGLNTNGHSGQKQPNGEPYQYVIDGNRNKRDVWTVNTQPYPEAHFATYPEELIAPMILAGCRENGIVLDPFMGAGTTGLVARKLGRNYLGIELNADYITMAEQRIRKIGEPLFTYVSQNG